jgi:superfamily II DNA or RNA helicase
MARLPTLTYDRGTLLLHPPARSRGWMTYATWDDRVEKFRIPGINYREVVESLQQENTDFIDRAKAFQSLELNSQLQLEPYPHQSAALLAWKQSGRQGVVVLPTGAGKTFVAQLAMAATPRSTLIVVPTIDLMHQWYAQLLTAFPGTEIGLLGGGSRDRTPILIATYDSAAIQIESLGDLYGLLIFDECHHLPTEFYRVVAEYSIAPYRLGLSATPERSDGKHEDLELLIGKEVHRQTAADLAGSALAPYRVEQIKVKLSTEELNRYHELIQERDRFLRSQKISFGSIDGWQKFIRASCRSTEGRRAMLAHREAKEITLSTNGKLRILAEILARHYPESTLIFTSDNATVYRIAQTLLIPAITHHTPVKERHEILTHFREGTYKTLVASQVLNEGVDVPAASIAVILSGTASPREYIQRLGRILRKGKADKQAILYEVISEGTSEERISARRRGEMPADLPVQAPETAKVIQLPLKYTQDIDRSRKVAEADADNRPLDPNDGLKY